jgi:hypothetical protein
VSKTVIDEMKRIVLESGILDCKDTEWPKPDKIGKQELVVRVGSKEVSLQTSKIGSYAEVQKNKDSEGLTAFFYLVQDLKAFVFSLVNLHFRVGVLLCRSSPSDALRCIVYPILISVFEGQNRERSDSQRVDFDSSLRASAMRFVVLVVANNQLQALVA